MKYLLHPLRVVRRLARDSDVVGMAFCHAGVGYSAEFGLVEVGDMFGAAIAHSGAQPARHLVNHFKQIAFVRYSAGDTFGH